MTLVKFNRVNSNSDSLQNQASMPSITSEFGSIWPLLAQPLIGRDFFQDFFDDTRNLGIGTIGTSLPAVNITETDTDLIIEVAAPGMNKKDFKVEVTENKLEIAYQKESEEEQKGGNQWRKEFSFGSFQRNFTLPPIVDSTKVSAKYTDGILMIEIPKKEEARKKAPLTIDIK